MNDIVLTYGNMAEGAPTVIAYGNCQVPALCEQLSRLDDLRDRFLFVAGASYGFPDGSLPPARVPERYLRNAVLYLSQYEDRADNPARLALEAGLPAGCPKLTFPSFLLACLWPFASVEPRSRSTPMWPVGRFPYGNLVGQEVARLGLEGPLAVASYMDLSARKMPDLRVRLERDVARMRHHDGVCDVQLADYVLAEFRRQHLFWSYGHVSTPALTELVHRVARAAQPWLGGSENRRRQVLAEWGGALRDGGMGESQEPIDPMVAQALGLEYGGADHVYRWFSQRWTFYEYIERYIAYDESW